jgi:hypothetical protein
MGERLGLFASSTPQACVSNWQTVAVNGGKWRDQVFWDWMNRCFNGSKVLILYRRYSKYRG